MVTDFRIYISAIATVPTTVPTVATVPTVPTTIPTVTIAPTAPTSKPPITSKFCIAQITCWFEFVIKNIRTKLAQRRIADCLTIMIRPPIKGRSPYAHSILASISKSCNIQVTEVWFIVYRFDAYLRFTTTNNSQDTIHNVKIVLELIIRIQISIINRRSSVRINNSVIMIS